MQISWGAGLLFKTVSDPNFGDSKYTFPCPQPKYALLCPLCIERGVGIKTLLEMCVVFLFCQTEMRHIVTNKGS